MEQANRKKLLPWFLFTGLLTGSLDALLAIIINNKVPASVIFKFIASGVFGNAAFGPGNEMIYYGVLFHYFIAFTWTILFFIFYNKLINTVKFRFALMLVTGIIIWAVMNLLILPLSQVHSQPFNVIGFMKNLGALILAFGLPITVIADKYYESEDIYRILKTS